MEGLFRNIHKEDKNLSEGSWQMIRLIPRLHWVLVWGILLMAIALLGWNFFGRLTKDLTISGLYHPKEGIEGEVICFVPLSTGQVLEEGMTAQISLASYNAQEVGQMRGTITRINPGVASVEQLRYLLEEDILVNAYVQSGPLMTLFIQLEKDETSQNSFAWSAQKGRELKLKDFSIVSANVTIDTIRPITLSFPQLSVLFNE